MGTPLREARETFEREYLQRPDPPLLRQHLAHRHFHRHGALGAAPQAEGARPRPTRAGTGTNKRCDEAAIVARLATPVISATRGAARQDPTNKESAMADKVNNLQDMFLNSLRRTKTPVTMFLVKGVKLQGIITWFDNFSVLLRRDGQAQLIYKHAISTIMPAQPLDLGELERGVRRAAREEEADPAAGGVPDRGAQVGRAGDDVPGQRRHAPGRDRRLRPVLHAARSATACASSSTSTPSRPCSRNIRSTSPRSEDEELSRLSVFNR